MVPNEENMNFSSVLYLYACIKFISILLEVQVLLFCFISFIVTKPCPFYGDFKCNDTGICLRLNYECDGYSQCLRLGSDLDYDEHNCGKDNADNLSKHLCTEICNNVLYNYLVKKAGFELEYYIRSSISIDKQ